MTRNKNTSAKLSRALIALFALILLGADILNCFYTEPEWEGEIMYLRLRILVFACSVPAWAALGLLWRTMTLILSGRLFSEETVKLLRYISLCCFAAGAMCLAGVFLLHISLFVAAAAGALMGLIVRIVKNAVEEAVSMKSELDLTI